MTVGCVVLTTGHRPRELAAAIESVRHQHGIEVEVVIVWNAAEGVRPDVEGVRVVEPGVNLGIPAGRNVGVEHLPGHELILFLDDDAVLVGEDVLRSAVDAFDRDPSLGAISLRIVDPETGETQRRHVPRLRVGDPSRSSWVTTFLGGASIVRRDAFVAVGGLPGEFFYAHEETSLAWRMLDRGYRIWYAGDLQLAHPALPPSRHAEYHRLTARNRVLLARKHLPGPIAVVYVPLWFLVSLARDRASWRATLGGFRAGLRFPGVERDPIRWRTVLRMLWYGRPPLL